VPPTPGDQAAPTPGVKPYQPSPPQPNEDPYHRAMREGMEAVKHRDFTAAVGWFNKALDERPDDEQAQQNLQQAQAALKDTGAAAPTGKPGTLLEAIKLAQDTHKMGQTDAAIAALEEALKEGRGTAAEREIANNLLVQFKNEVWRTNAMNNGNLEEAKKALLQARANTTTPAVEQKIDAMLKNLEAAYKEQRYKGAMDEGRRLQEDRNFNGALVAFNKALQEKPEDEDALEAIKECKQKLGLGGGNSKRPYR
jgi:tetratricopeptide (TPR) repeat protein